MVSVHVVQALHVQMMGFEIFFLKKNRANYLIDESQIGK